MLPGASKQALLTAAPQINLCRKKSKKISAKFQKILWFSGSEPSTKQQHKIITQPTDAAAVAAAKLSPLHVGRSAA